MKDDIDDELKRTEIGKRIYKAIRVAGLTATDVAKIMDVSPQAVQQWCAGKTSPKLVQLPKLANTLNTTVSHIILGESIELTSSNGIAENGADILKYFGGLTIDQQKINLISLMEP